MRTENLQGGTNRPGVPDAAFAMPPGHAMRYDLPAPGLRDLVSSYATYSSHEQCELVNWFLPAPPMICVLINAGPVNVGIRNHYFNPEPVSLYGTTSTAFRATTRGGIQVGIGLTALGWLRLSPHPASKFLNRVVPLTELKSWRLPRDLVGELSALKDETLIAQTVDALLAPHLHNRYAHEAAVRGLTELMLVDGSIGITEAADRLGIPSATLRRIAVHAFGIPPKLLLRRARFLRSFVRLVGSGKLSDYSLIDSSYYDPSHFLRDANTFLGTTPRRFMARETTFLSASLRARAAAIGPATHALHDDPR